MYTNISVKLIVEYFDLFWAMSRLDKGLSIACENIRFSSLFADGDARNVPIGEERGETDVFAG